MAKEDSNYNSRVIRIEDIEDMTSNKTVVRDKMGHDEVYNLLISKELSWQQMIHDLINSEQLDPWDIDLTKLTSRYMEKIHELEESNFIIPSKILLCASLLLRIKSEWLVDRYIKSLDELLFGSPNKKEKPMIEINLDDVAELFPRTPLPRQKRVTLPELIQALNRAMTTEHRRIKKEIAVRHALKRFDMLLPKRGTEVRFRIKEIYEKIKAFFASTGSNNMKYSDLSPSGEEKRFTFGPVLHLDNQDRILLEQMKHFDEIFIYLKNAGSSDDLMKDLKESEEKYKNQKMDDLVKERMEAAEEHEGMEKEGVIDEGLEMQEKKQKEKEMRALEERTREIIINRDITVGGESDNSSSVAASA